MNYCIYILSYKSPDKNLTLNTLKRQGYTGDYYIVVSTDDPELERYKEIYGDKLCIFDKEEYAQKTYLYDNFGLRELAVFARNYIIDLAETKNYDYFMMFDDDYLNFEHRYQSGSKLMTSNITNLDKIFNAIITFMQESNADCVAMAQGGDFIGGIKSQVFIDKIRRKAMNSFIFKKGTKIKFFGSLNEDVNMYCHYNKLGYKIFTICDVALKQKPTQSGGGLSDTYRKINTYVKSFYTVMQDPNCAKISAMGDTHYRIHHKINFSKNCPKILSDKYKK